MEQVLALHKSTGETGAANIIFLPTFQIYTPLLLANKATILSVPRTEHTYGPHPRQKLDVYLPPSGDPSSAPILVFYYGGGLTRGDKLNPALPDGLVYHNLGSFFAQRGIVTVIPDYRRVNSEFGGEDAVFPSGGEDVALSLRWVEENLGGEGGKREVVTMGNSAGGVHTLTFLLEDQFREQRRGYVQGTGKLVLKGAIQLSAPTHFGRAEDQDRFDMLKVYFGDLEKSKEHSALSILQGFKDRGVKKEDVGLPKILGVVGDLDAEEEIVSTMREFQELWKETWGEGIEEKIILGHNHISPTWALMAGEKEGEKWGEDIAKWIKE
ncbi:hypothetical protein HYFRA_00013531 [Hymenoscyphus fraxineus]|uniref:BD-FAE-like domain-containing protein n=1 Tax=Hymenoscyphus fraxineus TaxID=746836 RepID=A0A9N9PZ45_9HELO|nr:hypothetical protein HYFRA_00013531 [Hymenoscyphus fraxineus]